MKRFLLTVLLLEPLAALHADNATKPNPPQRVNIIVILADDLGYGDLGCYGQQKILTPNLDRLAAGGTRFTQVYAGSTVCAPSRCSLMTGMHNGHNRIRDNLPHGIALQPDDITLAEVLKRAGYRTGAVGKWSLGDAGTWGVPNYQGFDYWYGCLNQDLAINYYPESLWENEKQVLLQDQVMVNGIGKMVGNKAGQREKYVHDLYTEKAQAFIRENRDRPFFLYLAYTLPHFSDYPPESPDHFMVPSDAPYTNRDWPQHAKNYAAMISRLDRDIGGLMDLLRREGIEQNTLIMFTSDNGPYQGAVPPELFRSSGSLHGSKRDLYEGGLRVPMIVRWPAVMAPGQVSDLVWAFWDVLPTLAELAGLPEPKGIDGLSVAPTLVGTPKKQKKHDYLYWDYGHVRKAYAQAVRWNDWKGLRNKSGAPIELYDLKNDPGERHNRAAEHPEIVERIARIMAAAATPHPDYPIK